VAVKKEEEKTLACCAEVPEVIGPEITAGGIPAGEGSGTRWAAQRRVAERQKAPQESKRLPIATCRGGWGKRVERSEERGNK
jgi:hypothetical protein